MISLKQFDEIAGLPTQKEKIYEAAKAYINNGMYVVPLVPNSKRLPDKKTGVNYGTATKSLHTVEKWFHPRNGTFAGWNIGIACGKEGGVFAVDVDRHGDSDGLAELVELQEEYGELPLGPVQQTPSDGRHYLFRWQANALSSTRKIADSIDTRGGTRDACKGHIVAFPSVIEGREYKWIEGGDIPDIPPWVMLKMGTAWEQSTGNRGNENLGDDDLEKTVPTRQLEEMLKYINPDDMSYDEWLRIGMAIKSQYPTDIGLDLWDKWSRTGTRYVENECGIRWEGLDPAGPVRIGTLFHHAKEAGWEPNEMDVGGSPWDEIVERLNTEFALVVVGGKIRIIKSKKATNPWEDPYDFISRDDFKTLFENKMHAWVRPSDGRMVMRTEAEIWLAHQARREYPNGIGMFPNSNPPGVFNTWQGFKVEPREGDVTPYLRHVKDIICSGNNDHYEWVLDWLADLFQDPANPKGCAVVMKGQEGAGKGSFVEPIGKIFGSHYTHLIDSNHLTGRFTGHMEKAVLVFADEVVWGGDKKAEGKLKGLVTEKIITTERKGIDAITQHNFTHVIMASNNEWVIPAGPQSRRWFVVEISNRRVGNFEYFKSLKAWMENQDNLSALLHFFLNRSIVNNLRKAPETKELSMQRNMYVQNDAITRWWVGCLNAELIDVPDDSSIDSDGNWPKLIDRILVFNQFEDWCLKRNYLIPSQTVFYKRLKDYGLKQIRPRGKDGARRYKFEVPRLEDAIYNLKMLGIDLEYDFND